VRVASYSTTTSTTFRTNTATTALHLYVSPGGGTEVLTRFPGAYWAVVRVIVS